MSPDSLPRRLALVRHGEPDRSGRDAHPGLGSGLTPEGGRQALTAARRLAYSSWSWIATMTDCAGFLDCGPDSTTEAVGRLLMERDGDGIVVLHGRQLRAILAELCAVAPAPLAHGTVVVLRQVVQGWEISNGAAFEMAAVR